MDLISGRVRVELRCRYSERAVNICARHHIEFRDLTRTPEGNACLTVSIPGYMKLREVARDTGAFTVGIVLRRGAPFFLWRLRKRYALFLGLALCAVLTGLSTLYVWQIDVTGNETVPTSKILAALRNNGVDIGTCVLDIAESPIANKMLLDVPELSFITLNSHGSRIDVVVREKVLRPELYDPDARVGVFAKKPGIITEITALEGWSLREPGDAGDTGDELISSYVPVGQGYNTHASGEVWARTWYELTLKMPLETAKKEYTGRTKTRTAVILGGKRINLYFMGGNPYTSCDKITTYKRLTLPGGGVLPVTIVRERYEEYESAASAFTREEAEKLLSAHLLETVEREIGDGYVADFDLSSDVSDGVISVTLTAECVEQIGQERAEDGAE